ncbi:hypothetical protein N7507_004318 [Penicillium longicatenatum]|nr:hypothetical protein N7507_004318 [Penicillium longicatenatum]
MSGFNRLCWSSSQKAGLCGGVDDGHDTRIRGWLQYNSSDSARLGFVENSIQFLWEKEIKAKSNYQSTDPSLGLTCTVRDKM